MPFPSPPRALTGPRRRSLLASAAGAALLVGCSTGSDDSDRTGKVPSPDERARARAARDSEELAGRYDAVMAAHPALAERLRPLRAQIAAHVEAFGGTAKASPGTTASTTPTTASTAPSTTSTAPSSDSATPEDSGSPEGSVSPEDSTALAGAEASGSPAAPETAKSALASLAAAERSLSDRRTAVLLQVSGEPARLLASVAAAGAAHAYLLTEGDK
ncbi:hypothetical protein ACIHCX_28850 [Streptomyces sp. NPDC052043]|uniref:hypothetical protein n=1 Tax=Streptomyces sp. NPDC052043 TaxID=3365684 RepID=UPI0037CEF3C0